MIFSVYFYGSTPSKLNWYYYFVGNAAALTINDANIGDIVIFCAYVWGNNVQYLNNLTKTGLTMRSSAYNNMLDFMTREVPATGPGGDYTINYNAAAPMIIYEATSTTITASKSGTAYMVLRISDK